MKLGLFGGRFDPFHNGHLAIVRHCLSHYYFDRIYIIPTASPTHKPTVESFDHRVAMIHEAIKALPDTEQQKIIIDERENNGKPSWTISTVTEFAAEFPNDQFVLIIGADSLLQLHTWKNVSEITRYCEILVLNRDNLPLETIQDCIRSLPDSMKDRIQLDYGFQHPGSSTAFRTRRQTNLPLSVHRYASQNNLYTTPQPPVLGITGRVGSGKSTAANLIADHFDVELIDLDVIGHELLKDNNIILQLVDQFGPSILENGIVNRKVLGTIVFSDPGSLKCLNRIMHPEIRRNVINQLANRTRPTIIVGALISELGLSSVCDEIWVIDASDSVIESAIGDKFKIRHSQMSRDQYASQGRVISNTFDSAFKQTLLDEFSRIARC
ncbi:nicotinate (nicotinamide) nucleotide adenylyltransferase [bacterium]|nr:nicotinate (nicotinamide) nucleotide adenylyltransferase [bacterium]